MANAVTIQVAKAFPDIRVNSVDPGYTDTDLNGHAGTRRVAEGTRVIAALAKRGPKGLSGSFTSKDGPVVW